MLFVNSKLCYLIIILVFQIVKTTSLDEENINVQKAYPNETVTPKKINSNTTKFICTQDTDYGAVELTNATRLVEIIRDFTTNKTKNDNLKSGKVEPAPCLVIMFYAVCCIFSSQAAPHFNALPNFFSKIKFVAIDAMKYKEFNSHYGIVGVPTVMLIHDGKPAAKFNETVYSLDMFAKFITQMTSIEPSGFLHVTSSDFSGPVSSVLVNETDYYLILSWIFIILSAMHFISQSQWWQQFVECVQNTWRESNAQHEHID